MLHEIISLENVSYSWPRKNTLALTGINLSVYEGEFLAVMGSNGSGKSTLCRLLNGLIPHSCGGNLRGKVIVDGENTIDVSVPHLARKVGMVFDDPDMQLFASTVRHEAAFGPENLLLNAGEIEKRVDYVLDVVGLRGFGSRQPSTLSGGEKMRLAIAAALAMNGKILVLDEILSGLDHAGADSVMYTLRDLREKLKLTVIMTSHDSFRMAAFADRVCILNRGTIAACADDIFSDPQLLRENGIQAPVNVDISPLLQEPQIKSGEPAVSIAGLSYGYGTSACIDNFSLTVADNEFLCITGRNGCGKTTLLKNITGLLRPQKGDIYIRGKNTKTMTVSDIAREVGFVMQNPGNQLFTDTVYNEVSFALKNMGFSKDEINRRVIEALALVGLTDYQAFPQALSRPERTMTALASVLAMNCKIIILDEPDVGQDFSGSTQIMNITRKLHNQGYTIIFVTHNRYLSCEYSSRIVMME